MSKLDDAMGEHMAYIVFTEHRPFYCGDFFLFKIGEREYRLTHGTFRNKISKLIKTGEVEINHRSNYVFYTLKGHRFGKTMTRDPAGVPSRKSNSIYELLNDLPLGKNSLHDIRLCFKVPQIWSRLSTNSTFTLNPRNKDIRLPGINVDDLFIALTSHRTDTVSVTVGCSYTPIAIDIAGVIRLSNALTRVEERLAKYIGEAGVIIGSNSPLLSIPDHMKWIVKMWHFGADGSKEYCGERFSITYSDAQGILTRIYSKQMKDGKITLRPERQEYPNRELDRSIEDKLNFNTTGLNLEGVIGRRS
jgi:hypothetical protein